MSHFLTIYMASLTCRYTNNTTAIKIKQKQVERTKYIAILFI